MSTERRGFKITFFLPDGTPDGMKIIEKSNWTGQAIVCPRSRFTDLRARPEFDKTGVYLLTDQSGRDDIPTAYIGEGDPAGARLLEHQRNKDFWSSIVLFTSKDRNLNKAHVQYLEARLVQLADRAKRCKLTNGNSPTRPNLSESDIAEMEEFLAQMLLIYPTLGIDFFQAAPARPDPPQNPARPESAIPPLPNAPTSEPLKPSEEPQSVVKPKPMMSLQGAGSSAIGYETSSGFVVCAGSRVAPGTGHSFTRRDQRLRDHLIAEGVLSGVEGGLVFAQDYQFNAPSTAAVAVLGYSANGRELWKDETGRSLKELDRIAAKSKGAGA